MITYAEFRPEERCDAQPECMEQPVAIDDCGFLLCKTHAESAERAEEHAKARRKHHYVPRKPEVICSGCEVLFEDIDSVRCHQELDQCARR